MQKNILISLLISTLFLTSGCSVYMAAHQPGKKDLNVLTPGSYRDSVLAELGTPVASETQNGKKIDIFKFTQGYSKENKTVRAVGHGVADFFTLGLWEVVGTPTEAIADGREMAIKVFYDESNRVEHVEYLQHK